MASRSRDRHHPRRRRAARPRVRSLDRSGAVAGMVRAGGIRDRDERDRHPRWRAMALRHDCARRNALRHRMSFLRLEAPALIEVDHGSDQDEDPSAFRMLLTLDEQANGKTIVTLRQMHPTKARRDETIGFGAVEYGAQTLDKLARHVQARGQ